MFSCFLQNFHIIDLCKHIVLSQQNKTKGNLYICWDQKLFLNPKLLDFKKIMISRRNSRQSFLLVLSSFCMQCTLIHHAVFLCFMPSLFCVQSCTGFFVLCSISHRIFCFVFNVEQDYLFYVQCCSVFFVLCSMLHRIL